MFKRAIMCLTVRWNLLFLQLVWPSVLPDISVTYEGLGRNWTKVSLFTVVVMMMMMIGETGTQCTWVSVGVLAEWTWRSEGLGVGGVDGPEGSERVATWWQRHVWSQLDWCSLRRSVSAVRYHRLICDMYLYKLYLWFFSFTVHDNSLMSFLLYVLVVLVTKCCINLFIYRVGQKKVSQIIFAITLSTASQFP